MLLGKPCAVSKLSNTKFTKSGLQSAGESSLYNKNDPLPFINCQVHCYG